MAKKSIFVLFVLVFSLSAEAVRIECPTELPVQGSSSGSLSGWTTVNGGAATGRFLEASLTRYGMRCSYMRDGGDMMLERSLDGSGTTCSSRGSTISCMVSVTCPDVGIIGAAYPEAPIGWTWIHGGSTAATFNSVRPGGPGLQCVYTAPSLTVVLERPFPGKEPCGLYGNGFICSSKHI